MSADNAIYIREMPNGRFKVKCINSLYPDQLTDEEIDAYFSDPLTEFLTLDEAWREEEHIQHCYELNGMYIEYDSEVLKRKKIC